LFQENFLTIRRTTSYTILVYFVVFQIKLYFCKEVVNWAVQ